MGYSPWGYKESDMTERLSTQAMGLLVGLDKTEKNLSLRTSQDKLPKLKAKGTKTEKQNSESKD